MILKSLISADGGGGGVIVVGVDAGGDGDKW